MVMGRKTNAVQCHYTQKLIQNRVEGTFGPLSTTEVGSGAEKGRGSPVDQSLPT